MTCVCGSCLCSQYGSVYSGTYLGEPVAVKFAAKGLVDGLIQKEALETLETVSELGSSRH